MSSTSEERKKVKECLVSYLKECKRYSSCCDDDDHRDIIENHTSISIDQLSKTQIAKTRAMKQWYVRASDFTDLEISGSNKKSKLYSLIDVIRKADERYSIARLYEMVFDSKEAFKMISKKEYSSGRDDDDDDKEKSKAEFFRKYKQEKMQIFTTYLFAKLIEFAKKASDQYGSNDIILEAHQEFLQSHDDAIKILKAKWKEYELEYDELENITSLAERRERSKSKFAEIFAIQMEIAEVEKNIDLVTNILIGNVGLGESMEVSREIVTFAV